MTKFVIYPKKAYNVEYMTSITQLILNNVSIVDNQRMFTESIKHLTLQVYLVNKTMLLWLISHGN